MVRSSFFLKTSMWITPLPMNFLSATFVTIMVPLLRNTMMSSISEHSVTNSLLRSVQPMKPSSLSM